MHNRHEEKYIISIEESAVLQSRLSSICALDPHAVHDGYYYVSSIYFDDLRFTAFYEKENGVRARSKYRIRYYNDDLTAMQLERKSKLDDISWKDVYGLSSDEAKKIILGEEIPGYPDSSVKDFLYQRNTFGLKPVVIVRYKRSPYVYRTGNIRITFDCDVTSSSDVIRFNEDSRIVYHSVLDQNNVIMEVKYDHSLPQFMRNIIQSKGVERTSYSKYYEAMLTENIWRNQYGYIK